MAMCSTDKQTKLISRQITYSGRPRSIWLRGTSRYSVFECTESAGSIVIENASYRQAVKALNRAIEIWTEFHPRAHVERVQEGRAVTVHLNGGAL